MIKRLAEGLSNGSKGFFGALEGADFGFLDRVEM